MEKKRFPAQSAGRIPAAAGELNNLLHIIAGTADLIENVWHDDPAADKYLQMLRNSVGRAAVVTAQLVASATDDSGKVIVHPAALKRLCPPARVATSRRQTSRSTAAPRILVVDDEPMALELAEQALADRGFKTATAKNGFEGLSLFAAEPHAFALVVLDFVMPLMNGEETFDRLRTIDPTVPVLLSTGFADADVISRMSGRGLAGVLSKPTRQDEYIDKIESILRVAAQTRRSGTAPAK